MSYITYHEWCKHLRDAAIIDQSVGKLERVALQSGIPIDRLKRWLAKDLTLSHAEFTSLHEVLAMTHTLGVDDNDANAIEQSSAVDTGCNDSGGLQKHNDSVVSFDESD